MARSRRSRVRVEGFTTLVVERCERRLALAGDSPGEGGLIPWPRHNDVWITSADLVGTYGSGGGNAGFARVISGQSATSQTFTSEAMALQHVPTLSLFSIETASLVRAAGYSADRSNASPTPQAISLRRIHDDYSLLPIAVRPDTGAPRRAETGPSTSAPDVTIAAERVEHESAGELRIEVGALGRRTTPAGFDPLLYSAVSLTSQPMSAAMRAVTFSKEPGRPWFQEPSRLTPVGGAAFHGSEMSRGAVAAVSRGGLIDVQAAMSRVADASPGRSGDEEPAPAPVPQHVARRGGFVPATGDIGSVARALLPSQPLPVEAVAAEIPVRSTVTGGSREDREIPHGYLAPPPRVVPSGPAGNERRESWTLSVSAAAVLYWASRRLQWRDAIVREPACLGLRAAPAAGRRPAPLAGRRA